MTAPLIVFGEDWGRHPSATQHLAGRLAADRRVLWVNSVGLRRPRAADAGRLLAKAVQLAGTRQSGPAPGGAAPEAVMTAPAVPLPGHPAARAANRWLWRRSVAARARTMGLDRPILWLSLPTGVDALPAIPHRAVVYYCGDEFGALDGVDHAPVLALERALAEVADLILVSHPRLAAKFDPSRTVLLPHGVDLARFRDAWPTPCGARPVAGFVGRLDDRLDYGALAAAADALPGWTFVLAGPVAPAAQRDLAALAARPNVRLPGPVPAEAVPGLVKGWTVALLPYRDTPMTRACDPLKLREYLATGTPIAAFPLDGLRPHAAHLHLCVPGALAGAIVAAADEAPAAREARCASVAADDWSARSATVARLLEALS